MDSPPVAGIIESYLSDLINDDAEPCAPADAHEAARR
jgi:hypothetical protein